MQTEEIPNTDNNYNSLLKIAGVDMASPQPVKMAMETFKNLVDELEKML